MILVPQHENIIATLIKTIIDELDRIRRDVFVILSDEEEALGDELTRQLREKIDAAVNGFVDARSKLELKPVRV